MVILGTILHLTQSEGGGRFNSVQDGSSVRFNSSQDGSSVRFNSGQDGSSVRWTWKAYYHQLTFTGDPLYIVTIHT